MRSWGILSHWRANVIYAFQDNDGSSVILRRNAKVPEGYNAIGGGDSIQEATENALDVLAEQFADKDTDELLGMIEDQTDC